MTATKGNARKVESGICRLCGCTDETSCVGGPEGACYFADAAETLCSECLRPRYEQSSIVEPGIVGRGQGHPAEHRGPSRRVVYLDELAKRLKLRGPRAEGIARRAALAIWKYEPAMIGIAFQKTRATAQSAGAPAAASTADAHTGRE
jgi:hypothetical protein